MTLAEVPVDQLVEVLEVFAFAFGVLTGLVAVGDW